MYILKNTGKTSNQKHMQNIERRQTFRLLFLCRITMQNNPRAKGLNEHSESHTLLHVETLLPVMLKYLGLSDWYYPGYHTRKFRLDHRQTLGCAKLTARN